jgi:hypothetical protein
MARRWGKLVLAVATALVAWLAATPARAAIAPQCDPRGAITFAPPPQLQPPTASLDVDDSAPTCAEKLATDAGIEQGNLPVPTTSPEPVALPGAPAVPPASGQESLPAPARTEGAHPGVHARLERPPRP